MKFIHLTLWATLWLVLLGPTNALADITLRVSIKFFTDINGVLPQVDLNRGPTSGVDTAQELAQWLVDGCNDSPDVAGRGYRYILAENAIALPSTLSSWYNLDTRTGSAKGDLEAAAVAAPATYSYRSNAINIYVNNFPTSGSCSRPDGTMTFLGRDLYRALLAHEMGHFFDLCHTQGCQCNGTSDTVPGDTICRTVPGSDSLADTLNDLDTWTVDVIASFNFGLNYSQINAGQRFLVDMTYQNLMSYHLGDNLPNGAANPYNRLTDDQLDVFTNVANNDRPAVSSGRTWFTSLSGNDAVGNGLRSSMQLRTVGAATNAVTSADDVVLLQNGTYLVPASGTIATRCTLRATRGPVTIIR